MLPQSNLALKDLGDAPRKGCAYLCRNLHLEDIRLPANEACGDSRDWLEKQDNGICTWYL